MKYYKDNTIIENGITKVPITFSWLNLSFLTFVLLVLFCGCMGVNESKNNPIPSTPTTTLKQVNLSQEELSFILNKSGTATENIESFILDENSITQVFHFVNTNGALVGGAVPLESVRHLEDDLTNKKLYSKNTLEQTLGNQQKVTKETYILGDVAYLRVDNGNWTRSETDWNMTTSGILFKDVPLGEKQVTEVRGIEEIDGEECYIFSIKTSGKNLLNIIYMGKIAPKLEEEDIEVEEYTEWISKADFRVKRRQVKLFIVPAPANIDYTATYKYNQPVDIKLPPEVKAE
jgi:hypothetical protein